LSKPPEAILTSRTMADCIFNFSFLTFNSKVWMFGKRVSDYQLRYIKYLRIVKTMVFVTSCKGRQFQSLQIFQRDLRKYSTKSLFNALALKVYTQNNNDGNSSDLH